MIIIIYFKLYNCSQIIGVRKEYLKQYNYELNMILCISY